MAQQTHDTGAATIMRSARINGTAGLGFVAIAPQSTSPTTPASGAALYVDVNNNLAWKIPSGFIASLNTQNITSDRAFDFPNSSGQIITDTTLTALKGAAGGIAGLDGSSKVLSTNLPSAAPATIGAVFAVTPSGDNNANVALGNQALNSAGGSSNFSVAIGTLAMAVASGSGNVAIGNQCMSTLSSGGGNVTIGYFAGSTLTIGSSNTIIGRTANVDANNASNRIAIGNGAIATADFQFAVPDVVTHFKSVGLASNADGAGTLLSIDASGIIRKTAGTNKTVALIDTALAARELTANKNQAGGYPGLDGSSLISSAQLPKGTISTYGTLIGYTDLGSGYNVFLGDGAGELLPGAVGYNTSIGIGSLAAAQPGQSVSAYNTAIGAFALYSSTSGLNNTGLGYSTGEGLLTGSNNLFVGYGSDTSKSDCTGSVAIGYNARTTVDNEFAIADNITQVKLVGLATHADGAGSILSIDTNGHIKKSAGTNNTVALIDTALTARELIANKNVVSGYAGLDSSSQINPIQIERMYTGFQTALWYGDPGKTFYYSSDTTISTNTTALGDIICRTLTVNPGVTLNTAGYSIYCEKLVDNGIIANNGGNGTNGSSTPSTAGAGAPSGTLGGGMSGGAGNSTGTPAAAPSYFGGVFGINQFGASSGGAGSSGPGGLYSQGGANQFNSYSTWRKPPGSWTLLDGIGRFIWAGAGGGAGSGDGTNYGGAGGGGAGVIYIYARVITGTGVIQAIGGNGGNATVGNCGGGSGGGGGFIAIHTLMDPSTFTFTGDISGGIAGTGSGTGGAGTNGTSGEIHIFSPWTTAMP